MTEPTDDGGSNAPIEIAEMGAVFDQAWLNVRGMGLVLYDREDVQRERLAGIVWKLTKDGQADEADIAMAAAEEFRATSMRVPPPANEV